jgi:hypothetical protein
MILTKEATREQPPSSPRTPFMDNFRVADNPGVTDCPFCAKKSWRSAQRAMWNLMVYESRSADPVDPVDCGPQLCHREDRPRAGQ